MKKIVLVTGGFDPLHSGHIEYLKAAKELGDILVVGVNSDAWLVRKKGQAFMPLIERTNILRNLRCVDFVIDFNDSDNTAKHAIQMVRQSYPQDQPDQTPRHSKMQPSQGLSHNYRGNFTGEHAFCFRSYKPPDGPSGS